MCHNDLSRLIIISQENPYHLIDAQRLSSCGEVLGADEQWGQAPTSILIEFYMMMGDFLNKFSYVEKCCHFTHCNIIFCLALTARIDGLSSFIKILTCFFLAVISKYLRIHSFFARSLPLQLTRVFCSCSCNLHSSIAIAICKLHCSMWWHSVFMVDMPSWLAEIEGIITIGLDHFCKHCQLNLLVFASIVTVWTCLFLQALLEFANLCCNCSHEIIVTINLQDCLSTIDADELTISCRQDNHHALEK